MDAQQKAMFLVAKAIKRGELAPLDGSIVCVDCDSIATVYDHRDYARPLDVQAVCQPCNKKRGPAIGWNAREMRNPSSRMVTIRVSPQLLDRLKRMAAREHRTMTNLLELLIEKKLSEVERRPKLKDMLAGYEENEPAKEEW